MIRYLLVQLSSSSTSFCHYKPLSDKEEVLSVENLRQAIIYSMKENIRLNVLYPNERLSDEYSKCLSNFNSVKIAESSSYYSEISDVLVYNSVQTFNSYDLQEGKICILLVSSHKLCDLQDIDIERLRKVSRLNVVIQDFETMSSQEIIKYKKVLSDLSGNLESIYKNSGSTQVNNLSDILFLHSMNNCNAGVDSIALAPNGNLYLCPAFYYTNPEFSIGNPMSGFEIKNQYLLKLEYAPICRICDAFHCKRCIWLNKRMTGEFNTPSKEQCLVSHIERNESRKLLTKLRKIEESFAPGKEIQELDYMDPFEKISR